MSYGQASSVKSRSKVLLIAHCFDANYSMESRLSWFRATKSARHYDTTIICAEPFGDLSSDVNAQVPGLRVITVAHNAFEKFLISMPCGFYLAYRLWHRRVFEIANELHDQQPFSLVHQVSYCGYREPGYCWQLDAPFVWGPVGGTQNVPWKFMSQFDPIGAIRECGRSVVNLLQLHFGRRVGQALRAAHAVYVANREAQESFRNARGLELPCQLETGIEDINERGRPLRDETQPLRVLWAGRLENWKALPLLLKAVAQLPDEVKLELRVLGSGTQEFRWKRLAEQLGITSRVEWVPLPECSLRDKHYQWADVFAFTSLRDTSGTGLLEALAAGVPILGLDHQGARDIMADNCAVRIPVESPKQVVASFCAGLRELAGSPEQVHRLSSGAIQRAKKYHWDRLGAEMLACYAEAIDVTDSATIKQTVDSESSLASVASASATSAVV